MQVSGQADPPKLFVCEISESGVSLCGLDIDTRNIATVNLMLKDNSYTESYMLPQDLPMWKNNHLAPHGALRYRRVEAKSQSKPVILENAESKSTTATSTTTSDEEGTAAA